MPELVGALVVVAVAAGLLTALITRQRRLTHRVGSFSCQWNADAELPIAGVPGIAMYGTSRLVWWRMVSLSTRPARAWARDTLEVIDGWDLPETDDRGRPMVRVQCSHGGERFALSMSSAAYAGLISWLEARPRFAKAA